MRPWTPERGPGSWTRRTRSFSINRQLSRGTASRFSPCFELRIGELRVYYEVDDARRVVEIRAVGVKKRDRVFIGGEEIELS